MIGANLQFRVNITMFCDHDITSEDEKMMVRENVAAMGKDMAELLFNEYAMTDMDSVTVDLDYIDYLEPEDVDMEVAEIFIE